MNDPLAQIAGLTDLGGKLFKFGVWLVALVVLFVFEPPRLWVGADTPDYVRLSEFILVIVAGILVTLSVRGSRAPKTYAIAAAVTLVAGVALFAAYSWTSASWTCEYDGRGPVLIAEPLKLEHQNYPGGCQHLIQDAAGRTDILFGRTALLVRYNILAAGFVSTVLMLGISAFLTLRALEARNQAR
jgi:hypothetical protein